MADIAVGNNRFMQPPMPSLINPRLLDGFLPMPVLTTSHCRSGPQCSREFDGH